MVALMAANGRTLAANGRGFSGFGRQWSHSHSGFGRQWSHSGGLGLPSKAPSHNRLEVSPIIVLCCLLLALPLLLRISALYALVEPIVLVIVVSLGRDREPLLLGIFLRRLPFGEVTRATDEAQLIAANMFDSITRRDLPELIFFEIGVG